MLVKLYDLQQMEALDKNFKNQETLVRVAMAYEKHDVIKWISNSFGKQWASECSVAFSRQPISCFIATERGRIIGFAGYDCTCKNFFGPTGVAEDKRRLGIGRRLLLSCLYAMKADGYAYAIIGGVSSTSFYTKVAGATIIEGSSPGIYYDQLTKN